MIKIKLHKNLIYLLVLYVLSYLRKIDIFIILKYLKFEPVFLLLYMMNLGQITGGLTIYIYQTLTWRKKAEVKYFRIALIHQKNKIKANDHPAKIILLIFFSSFFDILQFYIHNFTLTEMKGISASLDARLGSISLITSSLICFYALRFKIGKHHKFSLIALSICLSIAIISDILFKPKELNTYKFFFAFFYVIIHHIFKSFTDCIERYLVDYNFLNPFKILMIEGIFEFIMAIIYSFDKDPFKNLIKLQKKNDTKDVTYLIILLVFYFLFSSGVNVYKVYCNVIYSPMAKSLMDYLFNPFFNILHFFLEKDFYQNYFYLAVCEILCLTIDFFCCVYLEYIIIYSCGLEFDTKEAITLRGLNKEMDPANYVLDYDDDEIDITINEGKSSREMSF